MPQLRLERGWSVDVGGGSWPGAESADPVQLDGKLKPGPGASASKVAAHQLDRLHGSTLELVAERGYGAVTVRDLAGRAGVSTRSFYQHYSGKEECFLAVHDLIARRILRSLTASNQRAVTARQKMPLAITTMIREWERDPRAAHLMLVDVYDAGPAAIDRAHRTSRSIESRMTDDGGVAGIVARGMLAGVTGIAQRELLNQQVLHMQTESDDLVRWALAYLSGSMADLEELHRVSVRELQPHSRDELRTYVEVTTPRADSDRDLLVSAVEKLIAAGDCEKITDKMVLAAAGVPRRTFEAHFSCLEDCLALILSQHTERALALARQAAREGSSAAGGVYRGVGALCYEMAQDSSLTEICFGDVSGFRAAALRLRYHQEVKAQISRFVVESIGPTAAADRLILEASVGAFWGAIQNEVVRKNANCLPRMTVPLAYLVLAPTIGPEWAIEAMRRELNSPVQQNVQAITTGRKPRSCT